MVETRIAQILSDVFGERLIGAALYGSFARGEADAKSDIDILIVNANEDSKIDLVDMIDDASERIRLLTGNEAQLLPMSHRELRRLVARDDPLIRSLRADGRSLVPGFELDEALHRGQKR
ncbi:MAG: nucleotidyltransferase domain-containing protein [Microbacteriaceae bacterium]|nr:nucleotidyltransferase domain-containing protein [Microbacteriaceae bacterium]